MKSLKNYNLNLYACAEEPRTTKQWNDLKMKYSIIFTINPNRKDVSVQTRTTAQGTYTHILMTGDSEGYFWV